MTLYVTQTRSIYHLALRLMNDELERRWKEAIVAHSKVLSRNSSGGTEENQDSHQ